MDFRPRFTDSIRRQSSDSKHTKSNCQCQKKTKRYQSAEIFYKDNEYIFPFNGNRFEVP